jgi:hypothetical protein
VIELLESRKLLDKVIALQAQKGNDAALTALKGVLNQEKLAQRIVAQHRPDELDLMLFTGVGAAYPLVRSHSLLNALHPLMKNTPLLVFFPAATTATRCGSSTSCRTTITTAPSAWCLEPFENPRTRK